MELLPELPANGIARAPRSPVMMLTLCTMHDAGCSNAEELRTFLSSGGFDAF